MSMILAIHKNHAIHFTLTTTPSGYIVSGSWDNKAIVWKEFQQAYVLEGHTAAVWAILAIDDSLILTASADKSIRLWRDGNLIHVYQGHTEAVRGLAVVPGIGFVSCSNDGTLRVWTLEGECIQQLYGHTSFVYSVSVLSTGEFVSSGEDRTVRIWKDGQCIQTLQQPCISVWTVDVLPNDDIVEFDELLASQAIPSNQIGDINKDKLPGPEALQAPGNKEGQVIMVNMGATVEAHQWSAQAQSWQKIGEVVGGNNRSKQTYEGKEYDYVFDIDVGAGPNGNLKLPYNVTENPYDTAQKFLIKHDLSQSFLDQVADFIMKNAEGVNLSSNYQDPFTGGSRYTPQTNQPALGGNNNLDPFTGSGSYRPSAYNTPPSATTNSYIDPFTGSGSYRPATSTANTTPTPQQGPKLLPVRGYLTLKQTSPDAVLTKIRSLNSEFQDDSKLTEAELNSLSSIVSFLKAPTAEFDNADGLSVVIKMASQWPIDKRFPSLDLIRLIALYAPIKLSELTPQKSAVQFLQQVGGLMPDQKTSETNAMLAYRGLANLFQQEQGRSFLWQERQIISNVMSVDVSGNYKSKNARLAQSTLAVK
ncbi:PLAA family ubiquitin binding-domain-containing protein [Gilbertella persicaria]|uniref:PLAA family ubiquitin binding-domain-containing protein n=1 Tax=Gilbertella persicaria TaxID=101096 RepID=UPI00221EC008|nr:PLAA family ubiquitin binding-domain-containing protein [Gilbertella persicaria]KAI8048595.1 PLAA family ubiquitin binding-domain-containing protein [Gilbertella persicaria]